MTHGRNKHAATLVGDLLAERRAFVALGAEESQLHQLLRAQEFLQLGKKFRREPAAAEFQSGFEPLPEPAQVGLLRTG